MFAVLKKGQNPFGGTYGSPEKTPAGYGFGTGGRTQSISPDKTTKSHDVGKYNHSQKDPIIVRGVQNVHPNHLAIRNYSIM